MTDSKSNLSKEHQENKIKLLRKLSIVSYFNTETLKIPLFFSGNEHYINQVKLDMSENKSWRTSDMMLERIYEAEFSNIEALFEIKFNEAKRDLGFKTKVLFAKYEAAKVKLKYVNEFDFFPILKQWSDFLENINANIDQNNISNSFPDSSKANKGIENLEGLFINANDLLPCIDILKSAFPKLLDGENNYLKTPKAAFILWIECLRKVPFIKPETNEIIISNALNNYFKGLDISAAYFRKTDLGKTEDKKIELITKLSHFAQKEK
jgi:hypothetical protein